MKLRKWFPGARHRRPRWPVRQRPRNSTLVGTGTARTKSWRPASSSRVLWFVSCERDAQGPWSGPCAHLEVLLEFKMPDSLVRAFGIRGLAGVCARRIADFEIVFFSGEENRGE